MNTKNNSVAITFYMPEKLKTDFTNVLAKTGSSKSSIIRLLICEYVSKMEQMEEEKRKKVIKKSKNYKKGSA